MMDNLKLIYVHEIGCDWEGYNHYEFLFGKNIAEVDGEYWDKYPASGMPEPPAEEYVNGVAKVVTNLKLSVIQNSDRPRL